MAFHLHSGLPSYELAMIADRGWLTIVGCTAGHSVCWSGAELLARFPVGATIEDLAARLYCQECSRTGSGDPRSGAIGFVQDTSPETQVRLMRKDAGSPGAYQFDRD